MLEITSAQNPKIKLANKLHDKRQRDREGLFVIDYWRDFVRAIDAGYNVEYVLIDDTADREDLTHIASDKVYRVDKALLQKASYRQNTDSIVAIMKSQRLPQLVDNHQDIGHHVLGLADLRKPGNIGALLRTADAADIDSIVLIDETLDLYNPNIIRSSTGACFKGNIYQATTQELIHYAQQRSYQLAIGVVDGNKSLYNADLSAKTMMIFGNEAEGLPENWRKHSHLHITIPMQGDITDSLNVSVSGALFMYEAYRQRQYLSHTQ